MSTRDSDDDIRRFLPDLDAIVREADPALAEEKHRKALDNPALDAALAEIKHKLPEGQRPFEFPIVPARPKPQGADEASAPRPSPWAGDAPPVEKALLPSSLAPAATLISPAPSPEGGAGVGARAGSRRPRVAGAWTLPRWAVYALAILAVAGPAVLVGLLARGPANRGDTRSALPLEATQASASTWLPPRVAPIDAGAAEPPAPVTTAPANSSASSDEMGPRPVPPTSATPQVPARPVPPRPVPPRPVPPRPIPTAAPIATDIMH